jgi:hypothetical protein
MQHRLEPALELRIGKSIAEGVQREFRDWSRPGPGSDAASEAQRYSKHGSGRAFSVTSAPMSSGLTESTNGSPLADRLVFQSRQVHFSFLQNVHTRSVHSKRRWLLPFQSVKKSRPDKPRPQQAKQCRALPHPNRQKTSRHSSQTLRRRKWSRRMRLGFKRDLARNRMTRSWQAQLAKPPRVAGDNRSARRRLEYESIHSFG